MAQARLTQNAQRRELTWRLLVRLDASTHHVRPIRTIRTVSARLQASVTAVATGDGLNKASDFGTIRATSQATQIPGDQRKQRDALIFRRVFQLRQSTSFIVLSRASAKTLGKLRFSSKPRRTRPRASFFTRHYERRSCEDSGIRYRNCSHSENRPGAVAHAVAARGTTITTTLVAPCDLAAILYNDSV